MTSEETEDWIAAIDARLAALEARVAGTVDALAAVDDAVATVEHDDDQMWKRMVMAMLDDIITTLKALGQSSGQGGN